MYGLHESLAYAQVCEAIGEGRRGERKERRGERAGKGRGEGGGKEEAERVIATHRNSS